MRTWIAVALVCASSSLAHAGTTLGVVGGAALMGDADTTANRVGSLVGASLSWEKAPPELPPMPGTAVARGQLIPEAGLMLFGDRGAAMLGARLQLDVAQHSMGLFQISARMSVWLAPRIGLVQGADGPIAGGDFGETFYWGHQGWRAGMVMGVYSWKEAGSNQVVPLGGAHAFTAEAPGSRQIAITLGLVIAK